MQYRKILLITALLPVVGVWYQQDAQAQRKGSNAASGLESRVPSSDWPAYQNVSISLPLIRLTGRAKVDPAEADRDAARG
ncbi:MAG TPA: hypothetical protein VLM38_09935 [Blastocatellia bacterium]|nr:hypothetical protein [Blastocatellia bacterium]